MSNNIQKDFVYEDISSSTSKNMSIKISNASNAYARGASRHIDKVIKAISFIVAVGIFLIFLAVAAVLVFLDRSFYVIALGVLVLGIIMALISLFLIYGIGHIISQNNEILKRL